MKIAGAAVLACVLLRSAEGSPDSSWRREVVDLARFEYLRSFGPWKTRSLSPAGQAFAVFAVNNVRIVDVRNPREGRDLTGNTANIHDSGWSRDGRYFATAGYDGSVRVWDTSSGKALATVYGHSGYACSVALSPDGKTLASGGSEDATVRMYEADGGREIRTLVTPGGATYAMGFTGDGKHLITNHADNSLRVWKTADGTEVRMISQAAGYVSAFGFSKDGRFLAYPAADGSISVLETRGWTEVRRLDGHPGGSAHLSFHPGGRHLASAGTTDGAVRLWEVDTGRMVNAVASQLGNDCRLTFSADGQSLIVVGGDDTVRIYGRKK